MSTAWLALGANIGEPEQQLRDAVARLDAHVDISVTAQSSIIVTKPWGKTDQPDFCNMAIAVETELPPLALLEACLAIERAMGRTRDIHWGPRLIDIDLIAYERLTFKSDALTLPHPFAHERDFVLTPLREIAPEIADWLVSRASPAPAS